MISRLRRKHRTTLRNYQARKPIDRNWWRSLVGNLGQACTAGLLATTLASSGLLQADDLGRPPAIFHVSDDAKPIPVADREAQRLRPQPAVKQTSAQWVDEAPTAEPIKSSNAWKLRWRAPATSPAPISEANSGKAPSPQMAVTRAVAWDELAPAGRTVRSPVRQASQQQPADPFAESAPLPNPNTQTPAPPRDAPSKPVPEFNDPFIEPPARPMPVRPEASDEPRPEPPAQPMVPEPAPQPDRDLPPVPPRDSQPSDSFVGPSRDDIPCDRKYNDRNCCDDEDKCQKARKFVTQFKLSNILLDITPSFTNTEGPSSSTYIPTEVRKEQELAKAPSRTWKNRAGEVVADGRFHDYHNGLVYVRGADGQTVDVPFNTLSDDDICFVTAWWSLPTECSLLDQPYQPRCWTELTMTWKASALCHKPLYFEEVALERYGHSVGPIKQPFISGAHFFGSLIALPYQMGIHPPHECQYALGYYRPGSCAPWLLPALPVSLRGALAEAGAVVGGIYIIP